jgi:hypothetical protein
MKKLLSIISVVAKVIAEIKEMSGTEGGREGSFHKKRGTYI